MKSIVIETVSNGWIVRPFSGSPIWGQCDVQVIAVFTKMEDMVAQIPDILNPSVKTMGPTKFCIPGESNETRRSQKDY